MNVNWSDVQRQLEVCIDISPDRETGRKFDALVTAMRLDGNPPRRVLLALLGALTDGIKYGNWPS